MNPLTVLSLCDGISTGRYVLDKLNIPVRKYYASEISKHAIKVSHSNYPDIIQLGDVNNLKGSDIKDEIDLLIFGSPCQSLSITNVQTRKNLDGKSKLFFECHRVLQEVKPKWFFMENVRSMKDECRDIISYYMGVDPIRINANLFSAQDRDRYYWTNIPYDIKTLPKKESDLVLKNILQSEDEVPSNMYYSQSYEYLGDKQVCAILNINGNDILKRVLNPKYKSHTLVTCSGGNNQKKVLINNVVRKLTPIEYERLQGLPDNYTDSVSNTARYTAVGNGWSVPVIEWFFKNLKSTNIC